MKTMNKKYISFLYVENKGFITCDFLTQVFISLFKIWLISQSARHCSGPDFQMPVSQVTLGLVVRPVFTPTDIQGKIFSTETDLCWWGMCLFQLPGTLFEGKQVHLPFCPLCKESHVNARVKWLRISHGFQWWFSPPVWVVTLDLCQAGLLNQLWGEASASRSHVHPWNPPLWRFSQIKLTFYLSIFSFFNCEFIPYKYNKTWPSQTQEWPFWNNSMWIMKKSDYSHHINLLKGFSWTRSHCSLRRACPQEVQGWESISAGRRPGLGSQMWCHLAVWPKACSFTWWNSHLFTCKGRYPFLPECFGGFSEVKIACVWCISSNKYLLCVRDLGRSTGCGMEERPCQVPPLPHW